MNSVQLAGRFTKDAELRYTGSGTAVASFTLAVDRPFKNANGEKETDFINCVAWRKTAEHISNYYRKGDGIVVTNGRIQTRNYDNNEGKKVYVTEVVAESVEFPLSNSKRGDNNPDEQVLWVKEKEYPKVKEDPFENKDSIDITDSDLPF